MYVTITKDPNTGDAVKTAHKGTPRADKMMDVVGGYFTSAGRQSSARPGVLLYVYCNDEGLLLPDLPEVAHVGHTLRTDAPYYIRGNLIVTACDARGNTAPMTWPEVEQVQLQQIVTMRGYVWVLDVVPAGVPA
jgi:hypothetical protein